MLNTGALDCVLYTMRQLKSVVLVQEEALGFLCALPVRLDIFEITEAGDDVVELILTTLRDHANVKRVQLSGLTLIEEHVRVYRSEHLIERLLQGKVVRDRRGVHGALPR